MLTEKLTQYAEKLIMTDNVSSDVSADNTSRQSELDEKFMRQALLLADSAAEQDEVPVGALIVHNGNVIAGCYNSPITDHDASAHAEINALRLAGETLGNYRLTECTLYVTLEPCTMCLGAMIHARISRLVFAANEPRAGAVESQLALLNQPFFNHKMAWLGGVLADESAEKLKQFFKNKRT